jgi:hypothetical protein
MAALGVGMAVESPATTWHQNRFDTISGLGVDQTTLHRGTHKGIAFSEEAGTYSLSGADVLIFPRSSIWLEHSVKRVQDLAAMEDGWDSYGGRRIQPNAIANTLKLLAALEALHFPAPHIAPVSGGALQVEWRLHTRELEIAIHANGAVDYLAVEGDDYDNAREGEILPNDLPALRMLAGWLKGSPDCSVSA